MKIIKETSNLMILKDWQIVTFFIGAFFCLLGVYLLFSSGLVKDRPLSSLPSILFFLVGVFKIFRAKTTTVSLNKGINKLSLERKTIINRKKEEYKLKVTKEECPFIPEIDKNSKKMMNSREENLEEILNRLTSGRPHKSKSKSKSKEKDKEKKVHNKLNNTTNIPRNTTKNITQNITSIKNNIKKPIKLT